MALEKHPVSLNFSQGLDTKTDDKQVQLGKMLKLQNSVFDKGGLLKKRNGFGLLTQKSVSATHLTTFGGGLIGLGTSLNAYNPNIDAWLSKGNFQPIDLAVSPLVRSGTSQTKEDAAIANGLVCVTYSDSVDSAFRYAVIDQATSQYIISPTVISATSGDADVVKVFVLGSNFIIFFHTSSNHLQYLSINYLTLDTTTVADFATGTGVFDGVICNNRLFLAYVNASTPTTITPAFLTPNFVAGTGSALTMAIASQPINFLSVCQSTDTGSPKIYVTSMDNGHFASFTCYDYSLNQIMNLTSTNFPGNPTTATMTTAAKGLSVTLFNDVNLSYSPGIGRSDYIIKVTCISQGLNLPGHLGSTTIITRGLGLASKATILNGTTYFLATYASSFQSTYFLLDENGNLVSKLAYSNGGGYLTQLPTATALDNSIYIPYNIQDTVQSLNKSANATNITAVIYGSLGINLAAFNFSPQINTSEIGDNLNISGGLLYNYDGITLSEQNFNLYPDNIYTSVSGSGGSVGADTYNYSVTYEWADASANIHKSAPSIPVVVGPTSGATSKITLQIPTLRATTKAGVNIVIYRWSTTHQTFYKVAAIANDPTIDYITYEDTAADNTIIGNTILYTTGGIVENLGPPATSAMAMHRSRLFLVDSEDKNLIWFSKQVIEATPVEMSDLFTLFVPPTIGAQQNTGPITALSSMDDKLIIFKRDAIYYMTGIGPDNTGANSDFSDPVFITSSIGCTNINAVVLTPQGLMFQSDKGIWLLSRDLSTHYIGAPVEQFNKSLVLSALLIPGTNQVRFTLDSGEILIYDYFYNQWGTFTGISNVSSTIYNNLHTLMDKSGRILQETPNKYLDMSSPVLISLTTGWITLAGLQGFERFYFMFLLGKYISPFKLNVEIGYDYNSSPSQSITVIPDNVPSTWGSDNIYGGSSPYGGTSNVFECRVFPKVQKCESFQITLSEVYDSSSSVPPGEGLTLSGMNLVVGIKKSYRTSNSNKTFG